MAKLLSGSTLRRGGSGEFIDLKGAMPQLPPSPSQTTGFTLITDSLLRTTYASSLGNLEFNQGTVYSNIPNQDIVLLGTGTGVVRVVGPYSASSTSSGSLVVEGGIGVGENIVTGKDITVNGLLIGQGYSNLYGGMNNIVIKGTATPQLNDFNVGQENIAIGYDALNGLFSAYKSIAIGRFAINSGTDVRNTIAIGDTALQNIGFTHTEFAATITNVAQLNPLQITVIDHFLNSGTYVYIDGVVGMTELNGNNYYIKVIDSTTLEFYSDNILNSPIDASGFTSYISDGTVYSNLIWNDNIAIGTNAGRQLRNGERNFFLGHQSAENLTTGSYNFFLGHEVGSNMTKGNANISIGGDNLVDGLDNQINIGSVFYYNGSGYLELNASTGIGYGSTATSLTFVSFISTISNATTCTVTTIDPHNIIPGSLVTIIDVQGMTELNGNSFYVKTPTQYTLELFTDNDLQNNLDSTGFNAYTSSGTVFKNELVGALSVLGGGGVTENFLVLGNYTATSTSTGALVVSAGVGIGQDLWVGGTIYGTVTTATNIAGGAPGSIPYQYSTGSTALLAIGTPTTVLISDGTYPYWGDLGNITPNTSTNAANVYINTATSGTLYYLTLAEQIGANSPIDADYSFTYDTTSSVMNVNAISITGTATSTSTTTGALVVAGGVGVSGSIYSAEGSPSENNLLYTPRVTLTDTGIAPTGPRTGDFWIDTVLGGQFQYIKDGTSTFWLQITTI